MIWVRRMGRGARWGVIAIRRAAWIDGIGYFELWGRIL